MATTVRTANCKRLISAFAGAVSILFMMGAAPLKAQSDSLAEWKATLAAAKGQPLKLLLQPDPGFEEVVKVFKAKFPFINVQATISHPSDAAPRIITEQKNGLYSWDAWWATAANMNGIVYPAGGLDRITDYLVLPDVKSPATWRAPDFIFPAPDRPYIFIHTHYLQNLGIYNASLVPGGKLTLENLLDPSLKKKISIRSPSRPHGGTMMLAAVAKVRGLDYVKKILAEMEPIYIDNDRQNTLSAFKGGSAVALGTSDEVYFECLKEGGCAQIKPFPAYFMHSRGVSVLKNAPNKAATKVFVNWLLSKEGQETYVREWAKTASTGAFSMRKDVASDPKHKGSEPDFSNLRQYVAVSLDSGVAELRQIIKLYDEVRRK